MPKTKVIEKQDKKMDLRLGKLLEAWMNLRAYCKSEAHKKKISDEAKFKNLESIISFEPYFEWLLNFDGEETDILVRYDHITNFITITPRKKRKPRKKTS